jgi:Hypoxia induced protein conserved region
MMGKALVGVAVAVVALVLVAGLYTLWKGGAVSASWSNKLMRIRVLAQAIAVVIILLVLYYSQNQ